MSTPLPWHERALIRQLAVRGFPRWLLAQRFGRHPTTISILCRSILARHSIESGRLHFHLNAWDRPRRSV